MFKRKILSELYRWKDSTRHEALLIRGARQVGKTYIIDHFISENFTSHIKLDLREDVSLRKIFDSALSSDEIIRRIVARFPEFKVIDGSTAIFIDEIQNCPNARMALKYMSMDARYKVIASGSLLGLTYSDGENANPVGYEKDVEMIPMDFEEFLWALGISQETIDGIRAVIRERKEFDEFTLDTLNKYFLTYCVVGGMPEAVSVFTETENLSEAREVQRKIVSGYRDDVAKYSKSTERDRVLSLYDNIPSQIGFDVRRFVFKDVEGRTSSFRTYEYGIKWLLDAGVVRQCCNLDEPKEPIRTKEDHNFFKIYLNDTGLMMSMCDDGVVNGFLNGDHRINNGSLIENAVAQNIYAHDRTLHYFAKDALEIDFITTLGSNITAMEVKSGNNRRSKSLDSLKDRYGVKRRMKFEKTNLCVDANGIEHYPLFASAFIDAMFKKIQLKVDLPKI